MKKIVCASDLDQMTDEEILKLRFSQLRLELEESPYGDCLRRLYRELYEKKLKFKPHFWVSTEWFTPDGIGGIGIPYYLLHPRLLKLEKDTFFEAEGESEVSFMKILRHETGHAIDNAYRLRRLKQRQELFGSSKAPYPDEYLPKPYSRKYVVHLPGWYAQAHPDEDFAETFAVWLTPSSKWRKKYQKWPCLKKLKFMDETMRSLRGQAPLLKNKSTHDRIQSLRSTLGSYYRDRQRRLNYDQATFFAADLDRIFSNLPKYKNKKSAAVFVRGERKLVRRQVSRWTGQYQYVIDQMIDEIIDECRQRELRLTRSERATRIDLVAMLTAQTIHFINHGMHRIVM